MRPQDLVQIRADQRLFATRVPQAPAGLAKRFIFLQNSGIVPREYGRLTSSRFMRQAGGAPSVQLKENTRRSRCLRASSPLSRSASLSLSRPVQKSRLTNSWLSTQPQFRLSQHKPANTNKISGQVFGPAQPAPLLIGGAA